MAEVVHNCCCPDCTNVPQGTIAEEHRLINQLVATFDEKNRRLYVAFLARQQGRGGIAKLARITGLSRNTIRRGKRDLLRRPAGKDLPKFPVLFSSCGETMAAGVTADHRLPEGDRRGVYTGSA